MAHRHTLLARTVRIAWALAGLCAAALAPAAAQPPADRTFSRTIHQHREAYTIPTEGRVGNHWVSIENIGSAELRDVKVVANGKDWSSLGTMLSGIVRPGMTDEQKARAIWQFTRSTNYQWWTVSEWASEAGDPVKYFNYYGYGLCSDIAGALASMYERAGLPTRFWHLGTPGAHVVSEVFYDGGWHLFDADRGGLYLRSDNVTVAGVEDLIAQPALVERAGPGHADLIDIYRSTPMSANWTREAGLPASSRVSIRLRPGESLTLGWDGQGRYRQDTELVWPEPYSYGRATLTSRLSPADTHWRQWVVDASGIEAAVVEGEPMFRVASGGVGEIVYRVESAYPVVGAALSTRVPRGVSADAVRVYATPFVDEVDLQGSDLLVNRYRIPGLFHSEENVATARDDGSLPLVHTRLAGSPAFLTFRLTPKPGERPLIRGSFYRGSPLDQVAIEASLDGDAWTAVWSAGADQLDYFQQEVDLGGLAGAATAIYARIRLLAALTPWAPWTAGVSQLGIRGIVTPVEALAWSAPSGVQDAARDVTIDLSEVVAPRRGSATYRYLVKVVLDASSGPAVSVGELQLTSDAQAAPASLPALGADVNAIEYSDQSTDEVAVRVTHHWSETTGLRPPAPPSRAVAPETGHGVHLAQTLALEWAPAVDPDGDAIVRYGVTLCADADCTSPLAAGFEAEVDGATPYWPLPDTTVLNENRTYYWRVRAQDSTGLYGPYGDTWSFTVASAPELSVTSPGLTFSASSPFVTIAGRTSGSSATAAVHWRTDTGAQGRATGSSFWTATGIPVHAGENRITVTAINEHGLESSVEVVVSVASFSYFLAEGSTGEFFDTDVAIANPNDVPAPVVMRFVTADGQVVERSTVVPALGRLVSGVDRIAGLESAAVSAEIVSESALPLSVERSMFWDRGRYGGHSSPAAWEARREWLFAEGSQGYFQTYVLLFNPGADPAQVRLTFMTEDGRNVTADRTVPATSRLTFHAGELPELEGASFSFVVSSDRPIVAERAMYFGTARFGEGGHAAGGIAESAAEWFFAEGATGPLFDTYILVGNPGPSPANLDVDFVTESGEIVRRSHVVQARSRLTIAVETEDARLANTGVSTVVRSDLPVVAERAMYWPGTPGQWTEAHSSPGATSDGLRWAIADARSGQEPRYQTYVLLANRHDERAAEVTITMLRDSGAPIVVQTTVPPHSRKTLHLPTLLPELAHEDFGLRLDVTNGVPIVVERATYWDVGGRRWEGGSAARATRLP
jgi:hypothetical protein